MTAREWQERAARTEAELREQIAKLEAEGLPGAAYKLQVQLDKLRAMTRIDREPAEKVRPQ